MPTLIQGPESSVEVGNVQKRNTPAKLEQAYPDLKISQFHIVQSKAADRQIEPKEAQRDRKFRSENSPSLNSNQSGKQHSRSSFRSTLSKHDGIALSKLMSFNYSYFNPLVPRVQKIKICKFTLNQLLVVEFVKKMVHLGAHYSERQGLMG